MGSIRIISTTSVCAATHKEEPNLRIDLATWDLRLLQIDPIQKGLLFRKPSKDKEFSENSSLIQHLRTSLSRTLDFFPPLAGRLAVIDHGDDTISFFIDCNNAGAEFVHATADTFSVADIIGPIYVPKIIDSFFPLNGVRNYEGISKPLVAVQVTELVDGIFIGCTMNHSVGDGTCFWHFFNSWSEISRGSDTISKLPVLQRWFLHDTDCPIRIPPFIKEQISNTFTPPFEQRVFHFTKEKIAKLKAKANAEFGSNKISSLQALLSHICLSAIRNGSHDPNQEVNFRLPVGVRARLQPPLPSEYFGNAIQSEILTMKARDQLEKGLEYVAREMNMNVSMHTDEKIRKFSESWRENPRFATIEDMASNIGFLISSSPRFNVYGNDFGWGRPIAVRSGPANKFDGKLTVFPGVAEGSIDIEACLSPQTLRAMENDAEFMDAVTA